MSWINAHNGISDPKYNLKTKFELVKMPNDFFSIFNRIAKDEKFYILFNIFQKN